MLTRAATRFARQLTKPAKAVPPVPARAMAAEATATTNSFRLGLCQTLVGADKAANLATAKDAVAEAVGEGAQVVCLPECFNSPYATDQFPVYAEKVNDPASDDSGEIDATEQPSTAMLRDTAKRHGIYLVGGSIPERDGSKVYNTCTVWGPDGTMLARHRKMHLFDICVPGGVTFRESDTLTAGDAVTTFDTPFCRFGVAICYDIRFPMLAALMRKAGAKVLLYPGAFNTTTGPKHWELLQRGRAVDNQCFVATASPARNPDSAYQAWGHSTVVDPWGAVVATTEHAPAVVVTDVDLTVADGIRTQIPVGVQERTDLYQLSWVGEAPLAKPVEEDDA